MVTYGTMFLSFWTFAVLFLYSFIRATVIPIYFTVKEQLGHSAKYLISCSTEYGTTWGGIRGWQNCCFWENECLRDPREINVISVPLLDITAYKSLGVERVVSPRMAVCAGRYLWLFSFPQRAETLCYLWLTPSRRESVRGRDERKGVGSACEFSSRLIENVCQEKERIRKIKTRGLFVASKWVEGRQLGFKSAWYDDLIDKPLTGLESNGYAVCSMAGRKQCLSYNAALVYYSRCEDYS